MIVRQPAPAAEILTRPRSRALRRTAPSLRADPDSPTGDAFMTVTCEWGSCTCLVQRRFLRGSMRRSISTLPAVDAQTPRRCGTCAPSAGSSAGALLRRRASAASRREQPDDRDRGKSGRDTDGRHFVERVTSVMRLQPRAFRGPGERKVHHHRDHDGSHAPDRGSPVTARHQVVPDDRRRGPRDVDERLVDDSPVHEQVSCRWSGSGR